MAALPLSPTDGPQAWLIDDGARLHLQHGPIDLLISAVGCSYQVKAAYRQATLAFQTVLTDLVAELPKLKETLGCGNTERNNFAGAVAQHMYTATMPFASNLVTPMIAVAGAVADHVLSAMLKNRQLQRISVNNGGDIALYLSPGNSYRVGICARPDSQSTSHEDIITLTSAHKVGGIATSGWRGRSHSLGVADAVTVLASNAAMADAAATIIANAIDVPYSHRILRRPASELNPDSDLGHRLVTVHVASLSSNECFIALAAGRRLAEQLCCENLIISAYLKLQSITDLVTQSSCRGQQAIASDERDKTLVAQFDALQNCRQYSTNNLKHRPVDPFFSTVSS